MFILFRIIIEKENFKTNKQKPHPSVTYQISPHCFVYGETYNIRGMLHLNSCLPSIPLPSRKGQQVKTQENVGLGFETFISLSLPGFKVADVVSPLLYRWTKSSYFCSESQLCSEPFCGHTILKGRKKVWKICPCLSIACWNERLNIIYGWWNFSFIYFYGRVKKSSQLQIRLH